MEKAQTGAPEGDKSGGIITLQTSDKSFRSSGYIMSLTEKSVSYMNLPAYKKKRPKWNTKKQRAHGTKKP
jgi:hypothetical protein